MPARPGRQHSARRSGPLWRPPRDACAGSRSNPTERLQHEEAANRRKCVARGAGRSRHLGALDQLPGGVCDRALSPEHGDARLKGYALSMMTPERLKSGVPANLPARAMPHEVGYEPLGMRDAEIQDLRGRAGSPQVSGHREEDSLSDLGCYEVHDVMRVFRRMSR